MKYPYSIYEERFLLAACMLFPKLAFSDQQVCDYHFCHPVYKALFHVFHMLWMEQKPINEHGVGKVLQEQDVIDHVGSARFISEFFSFVKGISDVSELYEILCEHCHAEISSKMQQGFRCTDESIQERDGALILPGGRRLQTRTTRDVLMGCLTSMEMLEKQRVGHLGLSTGLKNLDKLIGGLRKGNLFVLAAQPGMGRTAFAMHVINAVAIQAMKPEPVAVFSLESALSEYVMQFQNVCSGVHIEKIEAIGLSVDDMGKIARSANTIAQCPLYLYDQELTICEFRSIARYIKKEHGIEFIVIDRLNCLSSTTASAQASRSVEVYQVAKGIKETARELDIPILALADLNRKPDERAGSIQMGDLRDSGAIENEADVIGFLTDFENPSYEHQFNSHGNCRISKPEGAEIYIAKNRGRSTGSIRLNFEREIMRFPDFSSEQKSEEDSPRNSNRSPKRKKAIASIE